MNRKTAGLFEKGRKKLSGRVDVKSRSLFPDKVTVPRNYACRRCKGLCGFKDTESHTMWCWVFNRTLDFHETLDGEVESTALVTERCQDCIDTFGAETYNY